jgi:hypothetical protein
MGDLPGMGGMEGMGSFMRGFSHMGGMGLGRMGGFGGIGRGATEGMGQNNDREHPIDQ